METHVAKGEDKEANEEDGRAIIQSEAMWRDFNEIVDKIGKELLTSKREMDSCTIMVVALLTFRSWQ